MAYLHLLSNHFPILGSLFGVLLLVVALLKPNLNTTFSAYIILLISGIGGFVAYFTGEPAEESIEHIKGISHKVIHIHEEMAENSLYFVFLLTADRIPIFSSFSTITRAFREDNFYVRILCLVRISARRIYGLFLILVLCILP